MFFFCHKKHYEAVNIWSLMVSPLELHSTARGWCVYISRYLLPLELQSGRLPVAPSNVMCFVMLLSRFFRTGWESFFRPSQPYPHRVDSAFATINLGFISDIFGLLLCFLRLRQADNTTSDAVCTHKHSCILRQGKISEGQPLNRNERWAHYRFV